MTSDAPPSFRRRPRLGRRAVAVGIGLSVSVSSMLVLAPAAQAQEAASSTVLFVVDTSGSMSGTPLDQAKQALHDGIDSLGPTQASGLRAYGGSCGDGGDLLVPIATGNASDLNAATDQLSAGGGTPTPDALQAAGADLPSSGNRTIVLISDGQSSCGDPCPVARQLSEDLGVDFKVHAVGFSPPDAAETELSCIAEATGGDYFTASNTVELSEAISSAVSDDGPLALNESSYIGLGDSYSSGEGAAPYFSNTAKENPGLDSYNLCHRSRVGYPQLLAEDESIDFADAQFWACSGAQSKHIVDEFQYVPTQPPQSGFVGPDTDIVTLTVGGNDVGFGSFAAACVDFFGSCAGKPRADVLERIDDVLPENLARAYDAVASKLGPGARVLVVSYPKIIDKPEAPVVSLFGFRFQQPVVNRCSVNFINDAEQAAAREVVARLNEQISVAVDAADERHSAQGPRFEFVDAAASDSPFEDHSLCERDSYFNSVRITAGLQRENLPRETFHPNRQGQRAYYELVRDHLLDTSPPS